MSITLTTLRDFADKHGLYCHCYGCNRAAKMSWMELAGRFGWGFPVSQVESNLVCKGCGSRNGGIRIGFSGV